MRVSFPFCLFSYQATNRYVPPDVYHFVCSPETLRNMCETKNQLIRELKKLSKIKKYEYYSKISKA